MEDSDDYNSDYDDYDSDMQESDDASDYGFDAGEDIVSSSRKVPYNVLSKTDLTRRRKEAIEEVTGVLGISPEEAARVLRKYKWDRNRTNEEWFSDMDGVRESVGIVDDAPSPSGTEEQCMICFDRFPVHDMRAAACKHYFCKDCWVGYISTNIHSGPACLDLRCPLPDCKAYVPQSVVYSTVSDADKAKYEGYGLRSFVEDNRKMCWCTGKGCENAIECVVDRAPDEPLDVICTCANAFCFNCKEEAHRPVQCETVRKWITKNSAESENLNWILANTKPCPKCCRPIEKNQGCMHMTCSQCKFEFCWLCQGDWKEHGERTGGFYACNRYESAKRKGELDEESRRRENAKQSLERYMHYFERWDAHHKARDKAKSDAASTAKQQLEVLSECTKTPVSQLKFVMDAWHQIIECRRILSWTYTYGYYQFMEEDVKANPNFQQQRTFFEFLQGDAERSLERLHEVAENETKKLTADQKLAAEKFQEFRKNLIGLTDVTHGFFDKLVKQLEKGFESLEQDYAGQGPPGSRQAPAAS
mmetsp:Transcript_12046/g.25888  ORF Transcript_12046/g.25888 Transcript_12046/m.25888 type:complete len:532 (+) Transcript_12046:91-1686(+)